MIGTVTVVPSIDLVYEADAPFSCDPHVQRQVGTRGWRWYAAGKGLNVARGVRALGAAVRAFTVGGGASGQLLRRLMDDEGIDGDVVAASSEIRINTTVSLDGGEVHLVAPSPLATPAELTALHACVSEALGTLRVLVVAGTCPAAAFPLLRELLRNAAFRGVRTVLDTRDDALAEAVHGGWQPWLMKPNLEELRQLMGSRLDTPRRVLEAAREMREQSRAQMVLVSMGPEGALLVDADGAWTVDAPRVTVRNTVGAGDAMVASVAVHADAPRDELLRRAVAAGCANVTVDAPGAIPREVCEALYARITARPL